MQPPDCADGVPPPVGFNSKRPSPTAKPLQQFFPNSRREAVARPTDVQELRPLVISKDQSIKGCSVDRLPGDDGLLALVDPGNFCQAPKPSHALQSPIIGL